MRKATGLFVLLTLVLVSSPAVAKMECVAGGGFRGRDGQLLDCLEGTGSDCMSCAEVIVIQG
jgi:hypothetical protein